LTKIDLLAIAPHPDDAELGCGGTLAKHRALGKTTGIIDLTAGELGTRGSAPIRLREAQTAAEILGLTIRENLGFEDGFFTQDKATLLRLIAAIRQYQPEVVLASALRDRHTDHAKGAELIKTACFLAGLARIETLHPQTGQPQPAWRPRAVYHFIHDYLLLPTLVVDVTDFWETKIESVKAYKTQFFDPESQEPTTPISTPDYFDFLVGRAKDMGRSIGAALGEGFIKETPVQMNDFFGCAW